MINWSDVHSLKVPEGNVRSISIGGVQAWARSVYNRVKTSIDSNGNIFNGTGYMENARLNSSGEVTATNNACVSGFIPYTFGAVIRAKGSKAAASVYGQYVAFYDAGFNCIKCATVSSLSNANFGSYVQQADGMHLLTVYDIALYFATNFLDVDVSAIRYMRVSMSECSGADFIVTIDEEIE